MSKNKNNNADKKMNIAMLGHKVVPSRSGGVELVLTTMAPLMVEKGHSVTCYNRTGEKFGEEFIKDVKGNRYKGVRLKRILSIPVKGISAMTSSFFSALNVSFGKYDIIHFHAEGPGATLWIPKLFGKRCIATVHGLDWQRAKWKNGFGSKYIKFGEKIIAKHADEIIVLSKNVQQYFVDTYGRKTTFIPNGVNKPIVKQANMIKKKYGLEGNDYFCSISRLTEEKGIHYLIEAYKKIETDKKLVIAGGTSDTDDYVVRLKEMAKGNQNIIFTGFVEGELLDELYSNAYVYILPSDLEGMPLSLLEAMSYGNAVIGSSIPEITEVVEDKAVIFEKGNVDDLAQKMEQLSDNPAEVESYCRMSSDFICGKYNWNDVVDRTLSLYQKK
ncbi:MAG: glycosyltransferase family 4 protein [Lachnospiraceae bacterium]|nr:glycosyltransferase family 4 protein [Lachnospiraceae bacterium]